MNKALIVIDCISDWTGRMASWLCPILVTLITFQVTMRFIFSRVFMWGYETSLMIGATIYVLAWSYVHRYRGHIRVDIFYSHLSLRGKAFVDITIALLLFFPLYITFAYGSANLAVIAWKTDERMVESIWLPPLGPIRTVVALGAFLFVFQGVANFIRDMYVLLRNRKL